jgi:hypothetical protein
MVRDSFVELYFMPSTILWAFCRIESPLRVRQTPSVFPPHAQRNAFRRGDDSAS